MSRHHTNNNHFDRHQERSNQRRRLRESSTAAMAKRSAIRSRLGKRARGEYGNTPMPFVPPEDWHEPLEDGNDFRCIMQDPGPGYRHILTPEDVRKRLSKLPRHFVEPLEVVQFSRMTRKKRSLPCYGMQWGCALYLYPIEDTLVEYYARPPKPSQVNEARMYGGRWEQEDGMWRLVWTEDAIRDFYLNNILIHELGHLLDERNSSYVERERYAEWFAIEYGYRRSKRLDAYNTKRDRVRRHHGR